MKNQHILFDRLYPQGYRPYFLQMIDLPIAALAFIIAFVTYFLTVNPSMTAGDSGELVTTVYNMGASHPPGYPLYGIIGKLFTFLRHPDIAYKINLLSVTSGAFTVLFTYLTMVKLLGFNRDVKGFDFLVHVPAIAATLALIFSRGLWRGATDGKFYALNTALVAGMFFVMRLWYEEIIASREDERLWLAPRMTLLLSYVMGISITVHQLPVWYVISWGIMLPLVIWLVISFKGDQFIRQFQERQICIIMLGVTVFIAFVLLWISAIKPHILFPGLGGPGEYRLVFPEHVPYILTSILIVPTFLSLYTLQNYAYHKSSEVLHAVFWIVFFGVGILSFRFLGAHAVIVLIPSLIVSMIQISNRSSLTGAYDKNWVDEFLSVLSWAAWLVVLAISVYLYLWVRAKAIAPLPEPKPLSWGDTQTIDILINHMLRKQYPVGIPDYVNPLGQIWGVVGYHVQQFGLINLIVAIVGGVWFLRRDPIQWLYFVISSFIFFYMIVSFINFIVDPRSLETQSYYFFQQYIVTACFLGFGYQMLLDFLQKINQKA
ncbi:MAG: glycosyltransferase family 117 protein [Brevinema sp.]